MADLVQSVAAVLGVVVAALGFLHLSKQIRKGAHSDIYAMGLAVKQALLEHPELRRYFFDNAPVDTDDEILRSRVETIASIYCLYFELIAISAGELTGEKEDWMQYIRSMHQTSPVIRDYINRFDYSRELRSVIASTPQTRTTAEPQTQVGEPQTQVGAPRQSHTQPSPAAAIASEPRPSGSGRYDAPRCSQAIHACEPPLPDGRGSDPPTVPPRPKPTASPSQGAAASPQASPRRKD